MENSTEKFLDFNGKNIYFKSFDGQWWIAIKPICEALNVDYSRQLRTLKSEKILARVWSLQTMHDASFRLQKMACLPEKFIYGWIFKIQSPSPELESFQWKCYEILFDYFHGAITGRSSLLKSKTQKQLQVEELKQKLMETEEWKQLNELESEIKQANKSLRLLDTELVSTQLDLWNSEK